MTWNITEEIEIKFKKDGKFNISISIPKAHGKTVFKFNNIKVNRAYSIMLELFYSQ